MKYLMILLCSIGLLSGQVSAAESTKKASTYQVVKSEGTFFTSLWGKIKRIIPKNRSTVSTSTAVLGVRGAETTESALKPYWEGDLSSYSAFRNEVKKFDDGTKLCESETPTKGTDIFEQLLQTSENEM